MRLTIEQRKQIENIYHKYFNGSYVRYWMYDNTPYMWVRFYLAGSQNELINGYWENDCFNLDFEIDKQGDDYILSARMKSFTIKPIFHKYNVYDGRVVAFRKVQGDFNKILSGLDKFFQKFHDQFVLDLDNDTIPDQTYTENSYRKIGELHLVR